MTIILQCQKLNGLGITGETHVSHELREDTQCHDYVGSADSHIEKGQADQW